MKPKRDIIINSRLRPKVSLPLRLDDQCLNAVVNQIKQLGPAVGRNIKMKIELRGFFHKNIPECLLQQIVHRSLEYSSSDTLNILDLFLQPHQSTWQCVDLVGSNCSFVSCKPIPANRVLGWWFSDQPYRCLQNHEVSQLQNILLRSNPFDLKHLSICISKRVTLRDTTLPNIVARATMLTRLTFVEAADNHLLRIIGTSCHSLQFLDVSFSMRVTDRGLLSLLLKRPPRWDQYNDASPVLNNGATWTPFRSAAYHSRSPNGPVLQYDRNPCASTLEACHFEGTMATWMGYEFVSAAITNGYSYACFPTIKIFGVKRSFEKLTEYAMNKETLRLITSSVENTTNSHILQEGAGTSTDLYRIDNQETYLGIIRIKGYLVAQLICKIEGNYVTSLVVANGSKPEITDNLRMDVETLGRNFPNLKYYHGILVRDREDLWRHCPLERKLFPYLQNIHFMCVKSVPILHVLKNAPSLKHIRVFNQELAINVDPSETHLVLTDENLERCLEEYSDVVKNLEEVLIQPVNLTVRSLYAFEKFCPKLSRIGNLESWINVTKRDVANFNTYLDTVNSQCVVTQYNNPPSKRDKWEWNTGMHFL